MIKNNNNEQVRRLETLGKNRAWLQSTNNKMATIVFALTLVVVVSMIGNIVQYVLRPTPIYFAQTPDLRITKLVSLDEPYLSQQGLLDWASTAVINTLSMDFLHWRKNLMDSRPNYSSKAFNEVFAGLKESGIMEAIVDRRLVSSAVKNTAPVITDEGVVNGRKSWRMEFSIILSFEGSAGVVITQGFKVNLIVSRANTLQYPKGVVIEWMLLEKNK